ncbi:MAG: hemerythrin domain-containing protein [Alphaproteobacteria bacterium]|nr:hemerythrin domain-containing protein [Alphaproteobacteria bacterium]
MNLKNTIEKAGKKLHAVISPAPAGDILDTLRREHDQVQSLLEKLVKSDSAGERRDLLTEIKAALIPHTKAEEKTVYDRVLGLKGNKAKVDGHEGYFEHEAASRMLANLGKIERMTSSEFTAAAKVLKELIDHHVEEEERNIWADVKENFSDRQRVLMNEEFEAAKKRIKIPH